MSRNFFLSSFAIIIAIGLFYYNPGPFYSLFNSVENIIRLAFPGRHCASPIEFSIGNLDSQFGISQADLINDVEEAGQAWEEAAGRKLFVYSPQGNFKINLIYDRRQQVTNQLQQQSSDINNGKAVYDNLKAEYDSSILAYNQKKSDYADELANFKQKQAAYQKKVSYWNSRGGAPDKEYQSLEDERRKLETLAEQINQTKDELNSLADKINNLTPQLNSLAQKLNLKVATFNNISSANGEEFNEGEYILDVTGPHINIYQFTNQTELMHLLEHELGHALGLEHVEDPKAIMYYLNNSQNDSLTAADIAELNRVCGSI